MNARVRALALSASLLPYLAASLPLFLVGRVAQAQPQDADTVEARKRFTEGVKLFDEKKYDPARTAFLQAYALKKHPDVLLNLAQTELLSGHALDAAVHFREFLKDPATASHPKRGDAEKGLADARTRIGRVQVTVDVADADVLLDGKKVGTSPLAEAIDVAPGPHVVEVRKAGKTTNQGVVANEGKIVIANLVLEGNTPAVVPPATGKVEPPPPPPSASSAPARPPKKEEDEPGPRVSTSGKREPFVHWATHSPIAFTGAGVAVLGLGLGVGFLLASSSAQSNADSLAGQLVGKASRDPDLINRGLSSTPCQGGGLQSRSAAEQFPGDTAAQKAYPTEYVNGVNYTKACSNLKDSLNDRDTDKTVSTVGFVVAGLGAATVVAGYFLTAKKGDSAASRPEPPRFMLAPVIGPGLSGLTAAGTF
jgi:hypothetical protein